MARYYIRISYFYNDLFQTISILHAIIPPHQPKQKELRRARGLTVFPPLRASSHLRRESRAPSEPERSPATAALLSLQTKHLRSWSRREDSGI
ncbi:hypothetical protein AVEN_192064-1 [Araneus ventricosus]|uniref:Uncharacterized protein n=1 Tax=Araneus ventricosus TaxID=182803 RepID=A0A4Y2B6Q6_ARAVE|nr:hypothetical protein AVEN_192064-1 [Araneus ventricosus]